MNQYKAIYGPVSSRRHGISLGIDPIGAPSVCSFDCVYCQLGEIQVKTQQPQVFVPTEKIAQELSQIDTSEIDLVTLSGSGEPTLASNLGAILTVAGEITGKPTLVLTNGTLLRLPEVRSDLNRASRVSVKLDAVNNITLHRINRPVSGITWSDLWLGIKEFAQGYSGEFTIQTMVLHPWDESDLQTYINLVQELNPKEIHLNTPTRPKPLTYQLDARGNHDPGIARPYPVQQLRLVDSEVLEDMKSAIQKKTRILVRYF